MVLLHILKNKTTLTLEQLNPKSNTPHHILPLLIDHLYLLRVTRPSWIGCKCSSLNPGALCACNCFKSSGTLLGSSLTGVTGTSGWGVTGTSGWGIGISGCCGGSLVFSLPVESGCIPLTVPDGASWRMLTVFSFPVGILTWTYCGLAWSTSTWSTNASCFLLTFLFSSAVSPSDSQLGMEVPLADRLWNIQNLSCGVAFVAVHNRDRTECRASGSTSCQWDWGRPRDFSLRVMAFHKVPFVFSIWPLQAGL